MDIPEDLVSLLAKAIRDAVWYKQKITRLLTSCGVPAAVQRDASASASGPATMQAIPEVIHHLNMLGGPGELPIRKLFSTMCSWKDFTSVEPERESTARASVEALRKAFDDHETEIDLKSAELARSGPRTRKKNVKRDSTSSHSI